MLHPWEKPPFGVELMKESVLALALSPFPFDEWEPSASWPGREGFEPSEMAQCPFLLNLLLASLKHFSLEE